MDAVTHAGIGCILAAPLVAEHPAAAACVALGSLLPDLDSLSRVFGKRAFLRWHQTWTHSLPVIACVAALSWPVFRLLGVDDPLAPAALGGAMALHALLDVTNTYGITLWAPFSRRRTSLEWVFFIDSVVLLATAVALALVVPRLASGGDPASITGAYIVGLAAYWACKAWLRRRAGRLAPAHTLSLIPTALIPWTYLGCAREGDEIVTFRMNALTGSVSARAAHAIADESTVRDLPEFRAMRDLSPAYHAVESGRRVVCRDLRTRNFGGRFGMLEVSLDDRGDVQKTRFHV